MRDPVQWGGLLPGGAVNRRSLLSGLMLIPECLIRSVARCALCSAPADENAGSGNGGSSNGALAGAHRCGGSLAGALILLSAACIVTQAPTWTKLDVALHPACPIPTQRQPSRVCWSPPRWIRPWSC